MTEERDPYAVLQLASSATPDEVATAYRRQARRHHPDVSLERDAEQRMAEVNAAWSLLRDPAKRAAWDRAHGITPQIARRGPAAAAPNGAAGPARSTAAPGATTPPRAGGAASARSGSRPPATPWRRGPAGEGAAGPPPGNPRGSVLTFGRHIGWSLGEIARVDPGYLAWLHAHREGAPYREEIDRYLAAFRGGAGQPATPTKKRRLFR